MTTFVAAPRWLRLALAYASGALAVFGAYGAAVVGDEPTPRVQAVREAVGERAETVDERAETVAAPAKFHAADSKFKASFPGPPERSTEQVDIAPLSFELTSYMYEADDSAYMVLTSPYAAELPFDFAGAAQAAADEVHGQLESEQERTFQGLRALEIVISFDAGIVRQLIVRAPDRIVQLIVASSDDTATRYANFRDSLEIL